LPNYFQVQFLVGIFRSLAPLPFLRKIVLARFDAFYWHSSTNAHIPLLQTNVRSHTYLEILPIAKCIVL